ncbi:hypothetical protein [Bradyrhizobium neotropicale]|uniref:DUF7694 domain-containing protein n=1 Tax=Bradyrhizobium neotropicale TaxID=1497615 RepID=UPI001AD62E5E|nr:hypothetical protein [Bradyrhizobium neotropicale]MBO4228152.1 hypothetical protein [Bradyrhizobium neotropicale]
MRTIIPERLEYARVRNGHFRSTERDGTMGAFSIIGPKGEYLSILSSGVDSETGWEHVSVSTARRTPNWTEMCFGKDLFWREDECVIQFHPPRSEYVNCHQFCLHLWKPIGITLPMPPSNLVGPRS